ncbi:hypothetical protein A4X09_0g6612 [Tilletia walkeri]|uniref:Uncharacterized protein n=1 Tax=Tilletia walkeri TaxID=117179 RepID=A0A8X7N2C2_9BASI|nr:hypothetical protein A4X09_0g6612 [Tilletia walkeri]
MQEATQRGEGWQQYHNQAHQVRGTERLCIRHLPKEPRIQRKADPLPPLIRSTALTLAGASAGVLGLRNFSGYVAISNESILSIATSFVSPCSSRRGSSIESQVVSSIRLSRSLAGLLVCLLRDLSAGVSIAQVFIEMLCTSALIFSVFMLVVEKHPPTYFAPIGIGLTLFTCHLFAVVWTGSG